MRPAIYHLLLFALGIVPHCVLAQGKLVHQSVASSRINLAGTWLFQTDSLDDGIRNEWFKSTLPDSIQLPGSMTTNGKGNDITTNTPWTGDIIDSSWFYGPGYAAYRVPGNIKIPFWLQPVKYYKGAAWYQKRVKIPADWKNQHLELFIERSHWETSVWVDDHAVGMHNSLGTPQVFDLSAQLTPGVHSITVRIDNRIKEINVGPNSHSVSDHTQGNWNGMVGQLFLVAHPQIFIADVQLIPEIDSKQVNAKMTVHNGTSLPALVELELLATAGNRTAQKLTPLRRQIELHPGTNEIDLVYSMGIHPLLWDEFAPNLYNFKATMRAGNAVDEKVVSFGMRAFKTRGTQFTINDRPTFLRGTLECAIFPKTGFPPTDVDSWLRIFRKAKSYGLNHIRFHSWCPPEAAFQAADQVGFYLQLEVSSWANQGSSVGDGKPIDQYIYDESRRMIQAYGNHPSFCMLAYGNEPAGKNQVKFLTEFVNYWKRLDNRRVYTSGSGWPLIAESDYNSTADPRIQNWGAGLKSIINAQPPRSDYDWREIISKWNKPTVSHEIGQWCVYPDFKEINRYTGILKAKNFEIFRDKLNSNGLGKLADSFLLASGKLQALCYKADIEAALRTPGFGGFQLLDLHDFPGQGTALVGVLNPFWEDKGYITGKEYSHFCNTVVPLARFPKMVYLNNESLVVPIEVAQFGDAVMRGVATSWNIKNTNGDILFKGKFGATDIALGNAIQLGVVKQPLSSIAKAQKLVLTVQVGAYQNSWDFFVYPYEQKADNHGVFVAQSLNEDALNVLRDGGKVLLTIQQGKLKPGKGGEVKIGFSSIFWNTAWTGKQPPTTLGILCNPKHPAFSAFPTDYYSNWQWWDAMSHSSPIKLDAVSSQLKPIVRVIDDWVTAQSLGLVFECRVGNGKLLVSGIDLLTNQENRPEARQLLFSLTKYMATNNFNPQVKVDLNKIQELTD